MFTSSHQAPLTSEAPFRLHRLEGGIFWLRWDHAVHVDVSHVWALIDQLETFGTPPSSILVDLNAMVTLSRPAFTLLSRLEDAPHTAVLGYSLVDWTIVTHFIEVHRPLYRVRYFENREEALTWLIQAPSSTQT